MGASLQTMLGASPTVWFPHAERGILVIGVPGSGKTFSRNRSRVRKCLSTGIARN